MLRNVTTSLRCATSKNSQDLRIIIVLFFPIPFSETCFLGYHVLLNSSVRNNVIKFTLFLKFWN